jgi:hypothetical protein
LEWLKGPALKIYFTALPRLASKLGWCSGTENDRRKGQPIAFVVESKKQA